jgi:hypothetical protein
MFTQGVCVVLCEGANSDDFLIVAAERPRRRTIGKRKAADGGRWERENASKQSRSRLPRLSASKGGD